MENWDLISGNSADRPPERSEHSGIVRREQEGYDSSRQHVPELVTPNYWHLFAHHKTSICGAAILGLCVGLIVTVLQTPVYRARTLLEIQAVNEGLLNLPSLSPTVTSAIAPPDIDLQTQVRILRSQSLTDEVIQRLSLDRRAPRRQDAGLLARSRQAFDWSGFARTSPREKLLVMVERNLSVRAQPNTRVVEVTFDSIDPEYAVSFANALAEVFIKRNLDVRRQATEQTGQWMRHQVLDLKLKLEDAERAVQRYALSSGLMFTEQKDTVTEIQLRQVQQELSRAQTDRIAKQSRYELAEVTPRESIPDVLDNALLRDYHAKLTDLRRQSAELLSSLTPANPKVVKVQAEIKALELAVETERASISTRIRSDYETARRREELLAADYASQARLVSAEAARIARYTILSREAEALRQVYESVLRRVKEADMASAFPPRNVRVIDPATRPLRPYLPNWGLNFTATSAGGLFLGFVLAMWRERRLPRIRMPGEIARLTGIAELGTVAPCRVRRALVPHDNGNAVEGATSLTALDLALPESPAARRSSFPGLLEPDQRPRLFADSLRGVGTSVLLKRNGGSPVAYVVSSPVADEGKTTVAAGLAVALAETGIRVLLIDGDLRRPQLHEIFGLENTAGLSELLDQPLEYPSTRVIQCTQIRNLWVITSGCLRDTDRLYSPRFGELIRTARSRFSVVLVDSPPMLVIPDARIMAPETDGMILVARADRSTSESVCLARERLRQDGTPLIGAVLNHLDPIRSKYTDYKNYYGHYYQTS